MRDITTNKDLIMTKRRNKNNKIMIQETINNNKNRIQVK